MNFIEGIQLDGATRTGLLCQFLCTMYARLSQYLFLDSSTICNAGGGGGCGDVKSEQLTYSNVLSKLTNSIPGDRVSCSSSSSSTLNSITSSVLSAVGLVFQLTGGIPLTQREQTLLMSAVSKFLGEKVDRASLGYRLSPWFVYQLARQANRYGQHEFACRLYAKLSSLVSRMRNHYYCLKSFTVTNI
ncbi:unnamed protein product [Trichobilharzia regenti]|nr:unnamed protein product [Trichobilharzia regenti]